MIISIKDQIHEFQDRLKGLVVRDISLRQALVASVGLHLLIASVLATTEFEKITGMPFVESRKEREIAFELVPEEEINFEKNSNAEDFTSQDHSYNTEEQLEPSASATNGARKDAEGNTTAQRQLLLLASLSVVDEMKSPFNFMVRQTPADSIGAFSPIQGIAPDTKSIIEALNSGLLKVDGFGRGNCPPGGGRIFK